MSKVTQGRQQALELAASKLVPRLPEGVRVVPRVTVGTPAAEVARLARSRKAELIVMGRGGGSTLRDLFLGLNVLLGTVAGDVLREVPCDVLVVPPSPGRRRHAEAAGE
ncbi:MAG TPA: universal stress protein [Myxococcaceae bacterium]|jgi:nucleotide-binding universal stress UspA family protein